MNDEKITEGLKALQQAIKSFEEHKDRKELAAIELPKTKALRVTTDNGNYFFFDSNDLATSEILSAMVTATENSYKEKRRQVKVIASGFNF